MPATVKICFVILAVILFCAVFAALLAPYGPDDTELLERNMPPTIFRGDTAHIFGTDALGRDIFSRLLYGTRISLSMVAAGLTVGGTYGVLLGLTSGYFGGIWDKAVLALVNFQQSVPYILIVLLLVVAFGRSIPVLMVLVGMARWETYAKLLRNIALSVKEKQHVAAAVTYNASSFRIILRHILPEVRSQLVVLLMLNFPAVLLLESSLSFVGIGVQPPTATLGRMVGEGRTSLMTCPWVAMVPTVAIVTLSYCVQRIGEWVRDELDVRMNANGAGAI
jgi:peptide/nickel transport system permease protein